MSVKFYKTENESCIEILYENHSAVVKEYLFNTCQHAHSDILEECPSLNAAIEFAGDVYRISREDEISSAEFAELVDTSFQ